MNNEETIENRRNFLRVDLELLSDDELQELLLDCHDHLASVEANYYGEDPDEVYREKEYDASLVSNQGRNAVIEWIIDYEFGA